MILTPEVIQLVGGPDDGNVLVVAAGRATIEVRQPVDVTAACAAPAPDLLPTRTTTYRRTGRRDAEVRPIFSCLRGEQ